MDTQRYPRLESGLPMSKLEFKLPDIGEGVTEGEIVDWLVQEGDAVAENQEMVEVMTDKATVTIGAPQAGKVSERRFKVGDTVPVGQVLVVLELGAGGGDSANVAPAAGSRARGPSSTRCASGQAPGRPAGRSPRPSATSRRTCPAWRRPPAREAIERLLHGQAARRARHAQARARARSRSAQRRAHRLGRARDARRRGASRDAAQTRRGGSRGEPCRTGAAHRARAPRTSACRSAACASASSRTWRARSTRRRTSTTSKSATWAGSSSSATAPSRTPRRAA